MNENRIRVRFEDPGMKPLGVEVDTEEQLQELLSKEGATRNYTRAYVLRSQFQNKRKKGDKFVRALGHSEWRRWDDMTFMEQHYWRLQDRG